MKRAFPDAWLILEDIKLLFLYCFVSGIHLSLCAYRRRKVKQSKQGRKKKKESTVYCRNSGNIESSKKDWENYLIINFKCQEWESWVLSSAFYLLVALLQLTGEDRRAASPHEWVFEDEVWPFTALQLPGAAGHSYRGNTALIQAPEVMCQGQWKRKVV